MYYGIAAYCKYFQLFDQKGTELFPEKNVAHVLNQRATEYQLNVEICSFSANVMTIEHLNTEPIMQQ